MPHKLYPHVMDEYQTLAYLEEGLSIARYGDGELNLCRGRAAKCQKPDETLSERLKEILKTPNDSCMVGIPRIGPGAKLPERKDRFWQPYREAEYTGLYGLKSYASAFITRPDSAPGINQVAYWQRMMALWERKKVLIVEGQAANFNQNALFLGAAEVDVLKCPDRDAFNEYVDIFTAVKNYKGHLVIISLGPTATVLSWDLSRLGFRVLDLGHLSFLYNKCFIRGETH